MIPVGPEEKPLLEHIMRWLSKRGVGDIVLLVGYRWRQVSNYFGDGAGWGVRTKYSIDTEEYKGTGGALLNTWRWRASQWKQSTGVVWRYTCTRFSLGGHSNCFV